MEATFDSKKMESPKGEADYPVTQHDVQQEIGGSAGMPAFLTDSPRVVHHSPPASGPGSRAEPLVVGRGSAQPVVALLTDTYYRSPVNAHNPVMVWTDGTNLFFARAEGANMSARPEPVFVPPPGYVAAELHWDRVVGMATGASSLVVVARKRGEPDLEVAVTNTLEQRASLSSQALGLTSGAEVQVAREGGQYTRVDGTSVALEFSGAAAAGPIHRVSFPEGFSRYRAPGGDHDLYIARGANPFANLVRRADGGIVRTFAVGTIASVVAESNGVVHLELRTSARGATRASTLTIDLRASPPVVSTAEGHASAEADYDETKGRLLALGIAIEENGLRMRVGEMDVVEQALLLGGGRGLTALMRFRALEGLGLNDPILNMTKGIGLETAYGFVGAGRGTPLLAIYEPFDETPGERKATVRHEMTHVVVGAMDAVNRSRMSAQERANLEGALQFEAGRSQAQARAGLLRMGEYGADDVRPAAGTRANWRSAVAGDPGLVSIWVELLRRYSFIPDPEGTGEFRGVSLADESRYTGAAENTGHPADSLGEFLASFVTCATVYRGDFVADVAAAESAGNARGGGGGTYLRQLYRRAWEMIAARYVPLGASPL
jgi:hypothetical protein